MKVLTGIGIAFLVIAGAMWLFCTYMALIDFGGFSGNEIYFVANFFGCFTIFGFMLVLFAYLKHRLDELVKNIQESKKRQQLTRP
jgi:hypothetical protein